MPRPFNPPKSFHRKEGGNFVLFRFLVAKSDAGAIEDAIELVIQDHTMAGNNPRAGALLCMAAEYAMNHHHGEVRFRVPGGYRGVRGSTDPMKAKLPGPTGATPPRVR